MTAVSLAAAAPAASSRGAVTGTVMDEHTHERLAGMVVHVIGTYDHADRGVAATATVGAEGSFTIAVDGWGISATTRTTDPTHYNGTRFGSAGTDVDSGSGFWVGGGGQDVAGDKSVLLTPPGRLVAVEPTRIVDTREDGQGPLAPGSARGSSFASCPTTSWRWSSTLRRRREPPRRASSRRCRTSTEVWTSILNTAGGRDVANLVTVPVTRSSDCGQYELNLDNNAGYTDLIEDLQGYHASDEGAGLEPVAPVRVLDTRTSSALGPRGTRSLVLAGPGRVAPSDAVAVAVTISATQATARTSYVSAYPSDATDGPSAGVLNAYRGGDVPNLAIVPLGPDGAIALYNDQGSTHVVVDVVGWFVEFGGADYYPVHTRRAAGSGPIGAGRVLGVGAESAQVEMRDDAVALSVDLTTAGVSRSPTSPCSPRARHGRSRARTPAPAPTSRRASSRGSARGRRSRSTTTAVG